MTRHVAILALAVCSLAVVDRKYHRMPIEKVATTQRTHVETCGTVVYRRQMKDGDWHLTLERKGVKLVLEFIPAITLVPPRKGQLVTVRGIRRYDDGHNWPEIHPVESWASVTTCEPQRTDR